MSWCPKCKTEYREGITKCADCGSQLVEELPADTETSDVVLFEESALEIPKEDADEFFEDTKQEAMERRNRLKESRGIYVESSQKAKDFKSGAFSLLFVGGVGMVFIFLIILDVIPLSMNLFSKYLILGVMGTLFLLFILMGLLSIKSYKVFEVKASEENDLTRNLTAWCRENLKKDVLDEGVEEESEELRYFRRTEKMKALISDKFLNLDAAFLDSFLDDIYPEIFEQD